MGGGKKGAALKEELCVKTLDEKVLTPKPPNHIY